MFFQFTTKDAGMGDEQAAVIENARDVFITECVLDVAAVTRLTALSDLTHDVVTEKPMEGEVEQDKRKQEKLTVLTNIVAVVDGEVKHVQTVILGESLEMSSVILQPSDEEDKGLEEIVTEGAKKSLLFPVKKVPRRSLLAPVKEGAGTS